MLIRAFAVDPVKDLALLGSRELAGPTRAFGRAQCLEAMSTSFGQGPTLVGPGPVQTQGSGHCGRVFAFAHSCDSQNAQFFERVVGQFSSISFHEDFEKPKVKRFQDLFGKLLTYE